MDNPIEMPFAPLGRLVDDGRHQCGYSPGDTEANTCPERATWHILWDTDWENGLACDKHMAKAQQRYVYVDRHPVGPDCAMPGAVWDFDEKRCGYPDDPEQVAQNVQVTAPIGAETARGF